MSNPRAFPRTNGAEGMSLREWYAGLAIQGVMAKYSHIDQRFIAERAFFIADGMIEEANKRRAE